MLAKLAVEKAELSPDGCITFTDIRSDLCQLGYSTEIIKKVFNDLINKGVLHTKGSKTITDSTLFYTTRLGAYLIENLCSDFVYLESVLMDAFIYQDDSWNELLDITTKINTEVGIKRLILRNNRINIFLEYMEHLERNWISALNRYKIQSFSKDTLFAQLIKASNNNNFQNKILPSAKRSFEAREQRKLKR